MVDLTRNNKINEVRRDHFRVCMASAHTSLFWKKLLAHPKIVALHAAAGGSRRQQAAAGGSVGPINRFAADLQGFSHDVFCQIKSNLTSQISDIISTSLLNFCFLISIVRLYMNEWTGNLSVILFAALLWMNWTVKHEHTRGVRGLAPPGKFEIQVIWKGWKGA